MADLEITVPIEIEHVIESLETVGWGDYARLVSRIAGEAVLLKRRVASLAARLEAARDDLAEARGIAKQLWREGGHETSRILLGNYPWMLEERDGET